MNETLHTDLDTSFQLFGKYNRARFAHVIAHITKFLTGPYPI